MKALRNSVPFLILLGGVASLAAFSSLRKDPPSSNRAGIAPLVETMTAARCRDGFRLQVDGEVVPFREINLASEVEGRIASKSPQAKAGSYVKLGEELFRVDRRNYEFDVRRLQETVDLASAEIEAADIDKANVDMQIGLALEQLALQRKEVARYESLVSRSASAPAQLEAIRRAELTAQNALQEFRNQSASLTARRTSKTQEKERALAELELATLNLERTVINSPVEGVVIEDVAEADDYVQKGAPLLRLEDTSKVEVRFNLRLDQLRWLWKPDQLAGSESSGDAPVSAAALRENYRLPQLPVTVLMELAGNEFAWPARLDRYDGAGIDPATRTVPCVAVVDNPAAGKRQQRATDATPLPGPPTLLRGMFVSVQIPVASDLELVELPSLALRPGNRVWVVDRTQLRVQQVHVAHSNADTVILLASASQIAAGDKIVTSPLPLAVNGMEVRMEDQQTLTAAEESQRGPL